MGQPSVSCKYLCVCLLLVGLTTCSRKQENAPPVKDTKPIAARVSEVSGTCELLRVDAPKWVPLLKEQSLQPKDIIRTGPESKISLQITGYGNVDIAESSLVSIEFEILPDGSPHAAANLRFGSILTNLGKASGKRHYLVRTPSAMAAVRGTGFITKVDRNTGDLHVIVLRGSVSVNERSYQKVVDGKRVVDNDRRRRIIQQETDESPMAIARRMRDLELDHAHQSVKRLQRRMVKAEKAIQQEARAGGWSEEKRRRKIHSARAEIEREMDPIFERRPQTLIVAGKTAALSPQAAVETRDISDRELHSLRSEFTPELIDRAIAPRSRPADSSAQGVVARVENRPPAFTSRPVTTAQAKTQYFYVAMASDPDGNALTYRLLESPPGMRIGAFSGITTWDPDARGKARVKIQTSDLLGGIATQGFEISVKESPAHSPRTSMAMLVDEPPRASFTVKPLSGKPGTPFAFNATKSTDDGQLKYRWDFDGDKKWDTPFRPRAIVRQVIHKSGAYKAVLQVKDARGQTSRAQRSYSVGLQCRALAGPDMRGNRKTNFVFQGKGKTRKGRIVSYMWDFDGDGRFDWRSETTGATSHVFGRPGKFLSVLQVKSKDGCLATDTSIVRIRNLPIVVRAGKDITVSLHAKVAFAGKANDPDGTIRKYEWDFDGDGEFDWGSGLSANVGYVFKKTGRFFSILRATADDGTRASDTLKVTVTE